MAVNRLGVGDITYVRLDEPAWAGGCREPSLYGCFSVITFQAARAGWRTVGRLRQCPSDCEAEARRAAGPRHRLRTIRVYEYRDGVTLLADFWTTVDAVVRERGVIP